MIDGSYLQDLAGIIQSLYLNTNNNRKWRKRE